MSVPEALPGKEVCEELVPEKLMVKSEELAVPPLVLTTCFITIICALGGGGGAGALLWEKNGVTNPTSELVDGFRLECFANGDTQEIYALITVPETYEAGTQLKLLYGAFFLSATSGKVLFKAQTALVRDASTVLGTYSNIHTSTNSEVTAAGVANTLTAIGDIDLTNASGQINGVAVAAGDKLRVRLYRDNASESSPAAADAKLLINNFQLRFAV